jgi:hypothetical protein
MNAIKSKFCPTITDTHLADMLILSTRIAPNTDKLLSEKQTISKSSAQQSALWFS